MSSRSIKAGQAYVELVTENSKLLRGLNAAQRRLDAFAAGATAAGKKLMAAGAAVVGPLLAAGRLFAKMGDELDKMSARVGTSVEFLSALSHAAAIGGTDIAAMETGIRRMQRTALDATRGLSTAVDAFAELGIEVRGTDGQLKNTEQLFMETAAALSKVENNTKKAALAQMLFGRAGTALLPMLKDGKAGLLAVMEEAKRLGLVMSTEDATAAAELTDAWTRMTSVMKMGVFAAGSALAPVLESVADKITGIAKDIGDWIRANKEAVVTALKWGVALVAVGAGLVALGLAIKIVAFAVGTLVTVLTIARTAFLAVNAAAMALSWNPATIMFAALTVIIAAVAVGALYLTGALEDLAGASKTTSREMQIFDSVTLKSAAAMRSEADALKAKIARLAELRTKQAATNTEMAEAKTLVVELAAAYPDLASAIDGVGTSAEKTEDALASMDKAAAKKALRALRTQQSLVEWQLEVLEKQKTQARGEYSQAWKDEDYAGLSDRLKAMEEAATAVEAKEKELEAIKKRLAPYKDSDGVPMWTNAPDARISPADAASAAKNAGLQDKLWQLHARGIEDDMQRELRLLDLKYAKQKAAAQAAGQSVRLVELAQQEELAQIRQRYADEEAADRLDFEQNIADEAARLRIQTTKEGLDKELALLDLREKAELAQAERLGADLAKIRKRFDLEETFLRMKAADPVAAAARSISVQGTFSAAAAARMGTGGVADKIAENTKRTVDELKKTQDVIKEHAIAVLG